MSQICSCRQKLSASQLRKEGKNSSDITNELRDKILETNEDSKTLEDCPKKEEAKD